MSKPVAVTAALLNKIVGLLAPLFVAAAGGDMTAAREAANAMLADYNIRGDTELRLVALTVAFSFGALDALGQAANPDLSFNQMMRLRSNATALSRAGHQNQAVLDRLRKQAAAEPAPEPDPAATELPDSIETPDLVAFARSVMKARAPVPAAAAAPLSRQQRRAAERQTEKDQRRQEHEIRRAALLASRTIGQPVDA